MSDEAMEAFARQLASEVDEAIQSGASSIYSEEEFTRIVLDRLGDEGAIENPELLWQEGNFARAKYKITGYSMPEDEERLVLVTTIHTGEVPPRALNRDEILSALQQAMKFYECSCKGLHTKIEPSNTDASELARHIYEAREQIGVLRVVLLSDGRTGLRSIDLKKAFDGTRVIVDLFGIERLQRILGQGLRRDDIVVDFSAEPGGPLPCLKASSESADYEAYLTSVPGVLLADIYEKYGTRLLELNVRAFLGLRGRKSVNAGLRATIRDLPHRFLAYNNGIVATVDTMEVEDNGNGQFRINSVRGLQIVNGGQTTASLHRAKRQDGAKLDAISVPAKIICVGGADLDEMVAAVSKSANSQNTVQPADFSANDPFHVTVEKLANNTWLPDGKGRWFYERARGSYGAAELKASFAAG
jgi:AIPR protein